MHICMHMCNKNVQDCKFRPYTGKITCAYKCTYKYTCFLSCMKETCIFITHVHTNVHINVHFYLTVCGSPLVLLCFFTPYFYILGSGKEEVLVRGAGLLPEPKYIYTYIYMCVCMCFYLFVSLELINCCTN